MSAGCFTFGQTTQPKFLWGACEAAAKRVGISRVNLDQRDWAGGPEGRADRVYSNKVLIARDFVQSHINHVTHFLFLDGTDVVLVAGWDEILSKYQAMLDLNPAAPVIFSAEKHLAFCPVKIEDYRRPAGSDRCEAQYLNAGFFIASSQAMLRMLMMAADGDLSRGDQHVFHALFCADTAGIQLDYGGALCQTATSGTFVVEHGRVRNTDTGELPCAFHFPGRSGDFSLLPHILP